MIDSETFFVYGRSIDTTGNYTNVPMAISAFSSKHKVNERVDIMYVSGSGTHYGLNLPAGTYDLLIFADINGDRVFGSAEVVGKRKVVLNRSTAPEKVLVKIDVQLTARIPVDWVVSIDVPDIQKNTESLFFPSGTIRNLNDPIFDKNFSTLGMYDPASFLEQAATMFYALEEDLSYKIPIVFLHGISGSARDFETLVERLDRNRYKPWFFHYPSGGDLDQLAELFYQTFLSGETVPLNGMPMIIVAHSMGGLIVREAINKYQGKPGENQVRLLITMATPFGGHVAAAAGEKYSLMVLPSWRDLNPENAFIRNLYKKPLPDFVHHDLIYAYGNSNVIKLGENSDGVVSLSSQLYSQAQLQSDEQFGFNSNHTGILSDGDVIAHILTRMEYVENIFPQSHLRILRKGGYDVTLSEQYSQKTQHLIRTEGIYMMELQKGTIAPFNPDQLRFIAVANGKQAPHTDLEKGWLRFVNEYPKYKGN